MSNFLDIRLGAHVKGALDQAASRGFLSDVGQQTLMRGLLKLYQDELPGNAIILGDEAFAEFQKEQLRAQAAQSTTPDASA